MSHISADDVKKVAQLARLDLPNDKIKTYTKQLESILRDPPKKRESPHVRMLEPSDAHSIVYLW